MPVNLCGVPVYVQETNVCREGPTLKFLTALCRIFTLPPSSCHSLLKSFCCCFVLKIPWARLGGKQPKDDKDWGDSQNAQVARV